MSTILPLSSATTASASSSIIVNRLSLRATPLSHGVEVVASKSFPQLSMRGRMISCEVALNSTTAEVSSSSSSSASEEGGARIGARVRVKVPLKVYHVPKVGELDLTGMEGQLKQYVGIWKGKRISANLPFKVEFLLHVQGRPPLKFFAHLKDDEFDYIDS